MFSELANDNVELIRKDGTRIPGLKASVQKTKVFMLASGILVETGDLILRKMSNGGEETYEVLDPGFHEEFHGIDAHYQMDVRKRGLSEARKNPHSVTYNVTGPNARINQHSIDQSTNIVETDPRLTTYLDELRSVLDALADPRTRADALEVTAEIETQLRYGKPKRSVVGALLAALPPLANVAEITANILAILATK